MSDFRIQQIFLNGFDEYSGRYHPSDVQMKAALSIMHCKSGTLGRNATMCTDCGHVEFHNNSCRNRSCPNCQAVLKEVWIDRRRSEVFDMKYFHAVFTLPAQLNPLIYANQKLLYSLMHRCSADVLLQLAKDRKYLGATPSIIQVLHTWGQTLNFHPHIHCIVSGGGLTDDLKVRECGRSFFAPVKVMAALFRGKFLDTLKEYYQSGMLEFPSSCQDIASPAAWDSFISKLYEIEWCPYIKETFNGFGNAIDYLGRYTHRIAITNSRIKSVTDSSVTYAARDYRTGETEDITISCAEFIRRFLQHVLPSGFQKIRYFGLLAGRVKKRNLRIVFELQGRQQFTSRFSNASTADIILAVWGHDIRRCPICGQRSMRQIGRSYALLE